MTTDRRTRTWIARRGYCATYALIVNRSDLIGLTLWRDGAISVLTPIGMLQLVIGDWWQAHPRRVRAPRSGVVSDSPA